MATIDYYQNQWSIIQDQLKKGGLSSVEIESLKSQQNTYHNLAEQERKKLGYSGGVDGSQIFVLGDDPTTLVNEEEIFNRVFNNANLSNSEFKSTVDVIEKNTIDSILGNITETFKGVTGGEASTSSGLADIIGLSLAGFVILKVVKGVFK